MFCAAINLGKSVVQQQEPSFSIGDVNRMTGIAEATLRIWERRYHFPLAMRSSGGHRHYTQEDVLQLQWVKMHIDEGMRARRAVQARLQTSRDEAVAASLHAPLSQRTPDPIVMAMQPALLQALLAYDGAVAAAILQDALTQHSRDRVVLDLIGPTLSAIGECWSTGEADVATEHFASNFLRHQLLTWMRTNPPPFHVRPIVLACAPEELHEGSLLMLGVLLRRLRWPVVFLGQSLPLPDLAGLTEHVKPALIVFAAMGEAAALALSEWPQWLAHAAETNLPIIGYGGRAFVEDADLAEHVPGVLLGSTLDEGFQRIHRLMLDLNVLQA